MDFYHNYDILILHVVETNSKQIIAFLPVSWPYYYLYA